MQIYNTPQYLVAYATDASAYREMPQGVCFPETVEDIQELMHEAARRGTCVIPRAGGTSLAGQVVGNGIVADISRHWDKIVEVNVEERYAVVQPGVVRDELNAALRPKGLFFSPETSTSNRCCIGGMLGNNSCGTHSLVYGSTRHHVLACTCVLADGSVERFEEYTLQQLEQRFGSRFWEHEGDSLAERVYAQLIRFHEDEAIRKLIEDNYPDPSLRRRSCGYAIDEAIARLPQSINLCQLLAGSEGTLAFAVEIKISLDPLPSPNNMVVCAHCDSLEKAFLANLVALRHHPVAVELMDGTILELAKSNPAQLRNRFFVSGDPAALIIAELNGDDIEADAKALEEDLQQQGLAYTCTRVYGSEVSRVWALRKAGMGVLSGMKGDAKPLSVIEDTAVAPERLPAYMADFRAMMRRIGLDCVYYGHISTGELHLRPILNIKTAEGKAKFREVARESALLVRKHRGSLSGEHGDGRLRGEFIPIQYGDECYQLMRQVKHCWDPQGVMNVNKIVDAPPMDESLRFEVEQPYLLESLLENNTCFNWRAAFDECKVEGASGV
ncbi:MAG: FAD-binding oxidoreductase, partial [Bacteroidales bacterium]|nr:FAD-binding oxidoreductase [Bacteroidales bacterium]